MIKFILFQKYLDVDKEVWTKSSIINWLEQEKITYVEIVEENILFVVRMLKEDNEKDKYRFLELTPTISFIIIDDEKLDEFLELETNISIEEIKE